MLASKTSGSKQQWYSAAISWEVILQVGSILSRKEMAIIAIIAGLQSLSLICKHGEVCMLN